MGTLDLLKLLLRLLYYYCGTAECRFLLRGGGKRDRTADLLHAMQALSQLSYTPHGKTTFYYTAPASTSSACCLHTVSCYSNQQAGVPTGIRTPVLTVKG